MLNAVSPLKPGTKVTLYLPHEDITLSVPTTNPVPSSARNQVRLVTLHKVSAADGQGIEAAGQTAFAGLNAWNQARLSGNTSAVATAAITAEASLNGDVTKEMLFEIDGEFPVAVVQPPQYIEALTVAPTYGDGVSDTFEAPPTD